MLVLTGDDPQALQTAALAEKDLRTIPGLGSISSTASLVRSEIAVRPDFARAADLGVTSSAIAETLRIATVGDYDTALPKAQPGLAPGAHRRQAARRCAQDLSVLERLPVPGAKGPVLLGQVATLEFSGGPAVVDRYDRARNVNFEIELSGQPLGDVTQAVGALPPSIQPAARRAPDHHWRCRDDGRAVHQLWPGHAHGRAVHLHRAGAAVQDFLHPVTILAALPLSLGGAFVGLLIAQRASRCLRSSGSSC